MVLLSILIYVGGVVFAVIVRTTLYSILLSANFALYEFKTATGLSYTTGDVINLFAVAVAAAAVIVSLATLYFEKIRKTTKQALVKKEK